MVPCLKSCKFRPYRPGEVIVVRRCDVIWNCDVIVVVVVVVGVVVMSLWLLSWSSSHQVSHGFCQQPIQCFENSQSKKNWRVSAIAKRNISKILSSGWKRLRIMAFSFYIYAEMHIKWKFQYHDILSCLDNIESTRCIVSLT